MRLVLVSLISMAGFQRSDAALNIINSGTTLQIDNDLTGILDGFLNLGGVTLNGGVLLTNNDLGIPFSTSRVFTINTTGGTLEAAVGTLATFNGAIANGNGTTGVLTIGGSSPSGTVMLTAANTYTGGTAVLGATVRLSGAGTLGASGTLLTIGNGGTVDLNGTNQTVGGVTLGAGGSTLATSNGNATLTTTGVTVSGIGNSVNNRVAVVGNITQNANSSLTVNGTVGADGLAANAIVSGTGSLGSVTLANNDTVISAGTLHSAAIVINGTGNSLSGTQTVAAGVTVAVGGSVTQTGLLTGALIDNGNATLNGSLTGNATVGAGATLAGSGSISGTTGVAGGTLNGTGLNLTGLTTFSSAGNVLSGTETGNIAVATSATVAQSGTLAGNVNLSAGAGTAFTGSGSVGTVTLNGGGDTVGSSGTLATAGVAVNGLNNTIGSGAVTGTVTLGTGATLTDNGALGGAVFVGNGTLTGTGSVAGATTVNGGTINGTGLNLGATATFSGAGNLLGGTETGNVVVATGASLGQSGTLTGNVTLNSGTGTALTGAGAVGAIVLNGGGDSIGSSGTLTATGGVTVNGTGNTIVSGMVTGNTTLAGGASLVDDAVLNGAVNIGSGNFSGIGTVTGLVTTGSGGAIALQNGAIGALTVGALSTGGNGTPSALSFDLGSSLGVNDQIIDNGSLTLNATGGTTVSIGNAAGTTSLANGTYTLVLSSGVIGTLADLSLATTTLDGKVLSLGLLGNAIDLTVATSTTTVGTSYLLDTTAGASRIMSGQSTTLATVITNNGSGPADSLDYTGLGASTAGVTGATSNGGPLADGASGSNSGQIFTGTSAGAHVILPSVASATNDTLGTPAVGTSTSTTIDVLANRTETATSVNLGRALVGQITGSQDTTISSTTNDDAGLTRTTLDAASQTATGVSNGTVTLGAGPAYQFGGANDATNSTTRGVTGSFTTAGLQSGVAIVTPSGEGLAGEAVNPIDIGYVADAVNQRTIANGATTDLGLLHDDSIVNVASSDFTTTGGNVTTTSVAVAAGSGSADVNGVTLNGVATIFNGATPTASGFRTFGGTITGSGNVTGIFNLAVDTLENGGAGLSGETAYNPVAVGYSAQIYSGQGVYVGTGGGSYGTIATHPNFSTAGGAPGLDPNFTTTDTATFGNSIGATSALVTLDGANPSLNTVTFDNTLGGSYTLAQGTGGTLKLNAGVGGTAQIVNTAGNDTISAPVELDGHTVVTESSGGLSISGSIGESGGPQSLTVIGPGTTTLSGSNSYSGGTTLASGTLAISGGGTLGASTGSLMMEGGTLDLGGTTQAVGAVGITGAGTLQDGTLDGTSFADSAPTGTVTVLAKLGGAGGLGVSGAGTLALEGANTFGGGTTISGGTVIVGNLSALGTGPVLMNSGVLETGNGVHQINVAGNYTQTGGTLVLNLTGTTPGTSPGYEFLHVAGTANLGGALLVNVGAPYVGVNGDTFAFVQAGSVTGGFSSEQTNLYALSITPQGLGTVTISQLPFSTLPGVPYTPNESNIAQSIDSGLQSGVSDQRFADLVSALDRLTGTGSSPATLADAIAELSPDKFASFASTTRINQAIFDSEALNQYLDSRRDRAGNLISNGTQIDTSGLTVTDPSMDPGLNMVHSQLLAWNPAPRSAGVVSDTIDPMLAGIEMQDGGRPLDPDGPENKAHFFVDGNVVLAQGFSEGDVPHFDSTTGSVRLGGDYQFGPHFLLGALFDYSHTDATLDNQGSTATVDSYSPGLYASYADKGWYANALATYSRNEYQENRQIEFLGSQAKGSPAGNQISGSLTGGYDFHAEDWSFGPTLGAQYTHLEMGDFTESGSIGNLTVGREDSDSLRSLLGAHVTYEATSHGIIFHPHLTASWQHEYLDQSRGVNASLNAVGGGSFQVQTTQASRDSALIDFGLNVDLNRTATVFADYMTQVGQDDYFAQFLQAGMRIGF